MLKTELERFFEDLLAEPGEGEEARSLAAKAELAAALPKVSPTGDRVTATELAAHIDGALAADEADALSGKLAAEFHELEAAQHFLTRVSVEAAPVPPELVAAAVADSVRGLRKPATARRPMWRLPEWNRQWLLAGGSVAAMLFAVIITDGLKDNALPPAPRVTEDAVAPISPSAAPKLQPAVPAMPPVALVPPQTPAAPGQPAPSPAPRLGEAPASNSAVPPLPPPREEVTVTGNLIRGAAALGVPAINLAPAPAGASSTPEQVLITGSLIHGSAAVGVPVTNLTPQDFAQTGSPPAADLFRTVPPSSPPAPAVQAPPAPPPMAMAMAPPAPYASALGNLAAPNLAQADRERYPSATPSPVKATAREPVSTFSADVDTASYSNVRRFLTQGQLPPAPSVRVEEMINYFDYRYPVPRDRTQPFLPTVAVYTTPWNPNTQILHIGIKGFDLAPSERPPANLVFLIDTSGSMFSANKLPLLKQAFALLVEQLRPQDRVSIVTYAGRAGVALAPTSGADKAAILSVIDRLEAGGSTAGGAGIQRAYELAKAYYNKDGVNRVLLATDGDFNVGITDPNALENFVAGERSSGVFLTLLGFGVGNYNDLTMQKLAQAGNGVAAYIDTLSEARKVFVEQIAGTLFTIAKDVKFQVEFNPARVAEYRLIGYETRALNEADFNNDRVDAGDVGSGHTVTALYEITPVGSPAALVDPPRYGATRVPNTNAAELAFVKVRYKLPNEDESHLITRPVTDRDVQREFAKLPDDFRFAAAVAGTGQLLRHDPYIKSFDLGRAIEIAEGAKGEDSFGYRAEFVSLLQRSERLVLGIPDSQYFRPARLGEPVDAARNAPQPITPHVVTADDYPPVSIRLQEQGSVAVRYIVEADGSVNQCTVEGTSGKPRLDDAACRLVRTWRYTPASLADGRHVPIWMNGRVNFQLK